MTQIYARVTDVEKAAVQTAAELSGLTLSDFVRLHVIPQAYAVIKRHRERLASDPSPDSEPHPES